MLIQSSWIARLALTLCAFMLACSDAPTVRVSGPVTDLANGEPLIGATVCLQAGQPCTTTNDAGIFELDGVEAEALHALTVDLEGYLPGLVPFMSETSDTELAVISLGGDIIMELQMAVLSIEAEAGTGQVVFSISNGIFGDRINVPGIETSLTPGGGAGPYYLNSGGLPDLDLTETSTNGGGLFVNVPPGNHSLGHQNLPGGCTRILGWSTPEALDIPVEAERVTYARIECKGVEAD